MSLSLTVMVVTTHTPLVTADKFEKSTFSSDTTLAGTHVVIGVDKVSAHGPVLVARTTTGPPIVAGGGTPCDGPTGAALGTP